MDSIKKKLRKRFKDKKIIVGFIILIIFSLSIVGNFNVTYAEINNSYGNNSTDGNIDLDDEINDNWIITHLASFIFQIAGFIEWIASTVIGWITGSQMFPWADKVIFNTIPFLDINFINPESGSMFLDASNSTIFGNIIQKIYYTIYTISIAFLGVIVGVMAIKLAISSIASEKAKYKKAIENWILALILIFTIHYLISFIFFINEKLVEVASSVLISATSSAIPQPIDLPLIPEDENLELAYYSLHGNLGSLNEERTKIAISQAIKDVNDYIEVGDIEAIKNYDIRNCRIGQAAQGVSETVIDIPRNWLYLAYTEQRGNKGLDEFWYQDYTPVTEDDLGIGGPNSVFTDMSGYFKKKAYKDGEINTIIAILYAIFVLESFMYFISYIKRFFYVITLALFAPLIVIFDFFKKV